MSNLYSQLGYSIGEFQALQMIVLVVFGAVGWTLASCVVVHILGISFKRQLVGIFDITENALFIVFDTLNAYVFTHVLISHNKITSCFLFAFFHISKSALFLPSNNILSFPYTQSWHFLFRFKYQTNHIIVFTPSVMQLMSANYQVVIKNHIKWIWIASSLNHKLHTYRRGLFWGTLQSNSTLNPPKYYWFLSANSFVLRNKTKQIKTYVCHMPLGMIAVTFVNEWSLGLNQH